jgi:hypothetical protein
MIELQSLHEKGARDHVSIRQAASPSSFVGQGVLPLRTHLGNIEIFFLKQGPYWMLEMTGAGTTSEIFEQVCSSVRRLLTYLTGVRFDSDHCKLSTILGACGR